MFLLCGLCYCLNHNRVKTSSVIDVCVGFNGQLFTVVFFCCLVKCISEPDGLLPRKGIH